MENMAVNFSDTFKNRKVFLTGHTGFKGAWMLAWLHMLGAEVKGYSLAPENANDLFHLLDGSRICNSVIADIRDLDRLKKEILEFQPDFVFHLAAQPLVRLSYQIPLETFEVNGNGSGNLLEAVRYLDKPCVVTMITTDKVYHNIEQNYGYKEDDKLGGHDPYSASKAVAELIIDSYRKSFFNTGNFDQHKKSIAVGRAGNVIGGGDWAKDRIVPDIMRALSVGEPVQVRNPSAVRPWQHVLEPISGYLTLAHKQVHDGVRYAEAYNFGPELADNLKVADLVNIALANWDNGRYKNLQETNAVHEAHLLQLDISKAKNELGWQPQWQATQAINETVKWYKAYFDDKGSIKEYTLNSVKQFASL